MAKLGLDGNGVWNATSINSIVNTVMLAIKAVMSFCRMEVVPLVMYLDSGLTPTSSMDMANKLCY